MCRAAYYQLRQSRPLIRSLSFDAAKLLVQAFISIRLDCCNSLLYGISDNLYRRLEAVQDAAACLITNTRRCEHIMTILQQLHWLYFQSTNMLKIQDRRAGVQGTTSCLRTWQKIANLCLSLNSNDYIYRTSMHA